MKFQISGDKVQIW